MFSYLSPLLIPLFGEKDSKIELELDIQKILYSRTIPNPNGLLFVECTPFIDGKKKKSDIFKFDVQEITKYEQQKTIFMSYVATKPGYVEISFQSECPIFRRLDLAIGYCVYTRSKNDVFTIIPDTKFARPILVEQFREAGKFSLVHSAAYSNKFSRNSIFFVNPYEKEILVRIHSQNGKKLSAKVNVREAKQIFLDDILNLDEACCVQITANNRLPAWDLKHSYSKNHPINNVDHLDVFRGTKSIQKIEFKRFVKDKIKDALQSLSILR